MTEENTTADAGQTTEADADTYKAPATQDELNVIVQRRLAKEREKYSDYDQLKAAAQKLSEIEDANRSELEKATTRAEKAEAELAAARFETLKTTIAAEHGVSAEDSRLFLTAQDEAGLKAQAAGLAAKTPKQDQAAPQVGNTVPGLGGRSADVTGSKDALARAIFGL